MLLRHDVAMKTNGQKWRVLRTPDSFHILMIPRARLPPSVCLSRAVSTAAQQDWPSARFNFQPSNCRHSRERGEGRTLQQLRPSTTSGTNKTKMLPNNWKLAPQDDRAGASPQQMSQSPLSYRRACRFRRNLVSAFQRLVVLQLGWLLRCCWSVCCAVFFFVVWCVLRVLARCEGS